MADVQLPAWITVKVAAAVVGKAERTVYRWIDRGLLATDTDGEGRTVVPSKAVGRVALTQKRGRPRGIPTRR
ncbi:helix-turn-helix domain-containing protein [Microbacterium sp. 22296]|uniref:helix-turn-helix domain-containing protein n=1 Tax=Microbacterium sp. 22296 TaxID=3453903 RepID=UPI003F86A6E6